MRYQLILKTLKSALDRETFFHSVNLKLNVSNFINLSGYNATHYIDQHALNEACLLHDIGKNHSAVKKYIITGLNLSQEEIHNKITTVHTKKGKEQLHKIFRGQSIHFNKLTYNAIAFHHEPWKTLTKIPSFQNNEERALCNIISAFDILESLTSSRKYRKKNFNIKEALIILKNTNKINPKIFKTITNYFGIDLDVRAE